MGIPKLVPDVHGMLHNSKLATDIGSISMDSIATHRGDSNVAWYLDNCAICAA